nr:HrpT family type III secretion system protein [Salinicola sp. S1-1-2]
MAGCASRQECTDLSCQRPAATPDSMVIWWSPAMQTATEAAESSDYSRVRVPVN